MQLKFKSPIPMPFIALVAAILLPIMITLGVMVRQLFRIETQIRLLNEDVVSQAIEKTVVTPAVVEEEQVASPSPKIKATTRPMVSSPSPKATKE